MAIVLSAADQCGSAYDREEEGRHTVAGSSIAGGFERPIGNQDWLGHVVRDSNYNMRLKLSDISKYNIAFCLGHDRPIETTPTGHQSLFVGDGHSEHLVGEDGMTLMRGLRQAKGSFHRFRVVVMGSASLLTIAHTRGYEIS